MSKKIFKLSLNGRETFTLELDGDDELVEHFTKKAFMESIDSYDMRKFFTEFFINGIKHEIQVVARDSKGHFLPKPKAKQ